MKELNNIQVRELHEFLAEYAHNPFYDEVIRVTEQAAMYLLADSQDKKIDKDFVYDASRLAALYYQSSLILVHYKNFSFEEFTTWLYPEKIIGYYYVDILCFSKDNILSFNPMFLLSLISQEDIKFNIKENGKKYLSERVIYNLELLQEEFNFNVCNKPTKEKGYKTYLITDTNSGAYKIGKSRNPEKRIATLSVGNPNLELVAICESDIEKELHHKFNSLRICSEWFELDITDIAEIKKMFHQTKPTWIN